MSVSGTTGTVNGRIGVAIDVSVAPDMCLPPVDSVWSADAARAVVGGTTDPQAIGANQESAAVAADCRVKSAERIARGLPNQT